MNISQRLRTCAKHTALDAVIELLNDAADEIDRLSGGQQAEAKADEPVAWISKTGHGTYFRQSITQELASLEHGGRKMWRPLTYADTHPAPGVPDDVVKDAGRYRWLRDSDHWPATFASSQEPEPIRGTDLDSAIDAAMLTAAQAQKGQP